MWRVPYIHQYIPVVHAPVIRQAQNWRRQKYFFVVLNVFPSSSQYVPQYVPNSSSLNPISSSLVTYIFSPKEDITTCLFWDCEMHFFFFLAKFFLIFQQRNCENFGIFFSTNFFLGLNFVKFSMSKNWNKKEHQLHY
jgi:hypothetical protein